MTAIFSSSVLTLSIAGAVVAGVYAAAEATTAPLQSLPIASLRAQASPTTAQERGELANLYPLMAKAVATPRPPQTADDVIQVDDAFLPRSTSTQGDKPSVVDYFPLLQSNNVLVLQALTEDGAIINKHFYPCNSPLPEYAYPGTSGGTLTPRLLCTKHAGTVRITEPGGKRAFNLSLD